MLGYYDIGKNYYSNRQEKVLWMINYGTRADQEKKVTFRYQFGQQRIFEPPAPNAPYKIIAEQEVWGSIAQIIIEGDNLIEEFDRPIIRTYSGPNSVGLNDRVFASNTIHRQMSKDGSRLIKMSIDITPIDNNFLNGRYYGGISLKNKPEQYRANIEAVPITNIDDMREDILTAIKTDTAFKIDKNTYAPYGSNFQESTKIVYKKSEPEVAIERNCITSYYPMQGMYLCTYMSDKFNNWLDSEYIDKLSGVGGKGLLDVTEGLNLNVLQLAMKIYDQTNRIALSNRSYEDWMLVVHGQHNAARTEIPRYEGGYSQDIYFEELRSTAGTEGMPTGSIVANARMGGSKTGGKVVIRCEEAGNIIGIVRIVPKLIYSQGNNQT